VFKLDITLISLLMLLYMFIMVIIQIKPYIAEYKPKYKMIEKNPLMMMRYLGVFIFIFCSMNSFHQAYSTLKAPTVRRINKMGIYAISFVSILSLAFGMLAYFSIGQDLADIALFPDRPSLPGDTDIFSKILKGGFFISLMGSYAVNLLPIKDNIFINFNIRPSATSNLFLTLLIVLSTTTSAWAYPRVRDWLSLIGSFVGVLLSFFFPAITFFVAYKKDKEFKGRRILAIMFAIITTLIGMAASTILVLYIAGILQV